MKITIMLVVILTVPAILMGSNTLNTDTSEVLKKNSAERVYTEEKVSIVEKVSEDKEVAIEEIVPTYNKKTKYIYCPEDSNVFNEDTSRPRFFATGNGTVIDNSTDLIWLSSASCTDSAVGITNPHGKLNWSDAIKWTSALSSGSCNLSDGSRAGDWRLPTAADLNSLSSGPCAPNMKYLFNWKNNPTGIRPQEWLTWQGFSDIQYGYYWMSLDSSMDKFAVYKEYGYVNNYNFDEMNDSYIFKEDNELYIWPVRNKRDNSVISGYVYDDVTGDPITKAMVMFENKIIMTDNSGSFRSEINSDCQSATATKNGYDSQKSSIITFQNGEHVVDFRLVRSSIPKSNLANINIKNTMVPSNLNTDSDKWVCDSSNNICARNIKSTKTESSMTVFILEIASKYKSSRNVSITIEPFWGNVASNYSFTTNLITYVLPVSGQNMVTVNHKGQYISPTKMWRIKCITVLK